MTTTPGDLMTRLTRTDRPEITLRSPLAALDAYGTGGLAFAAASRRQEATRVRWARRTVDARTWRRMMGR